MNQHLGFCDLLAVVGVIFPFVAVVVAPPCIAVVLGQVGGHVPERRLVVVKVVVQVKHAGVNRSVRLQYRHVGQLDVRGYIVFPNGLNHAVLDEDVAFVDDICLAGHGHDSTLEHIRTRVDVIVESVAANHVLGDAVTGVITPAWRGRTDLGDRTIGGFDVGFVPPRVLSRVRKRVDDITKTVGNGGRVAVPIIKFNSRTLSEDDDVAVGFYGGVPGETTGARAALSDVVEQPIGNINGFSAGVPEFDELVGR